jgi:hypothetical protein
MAETTIRLPSVAGQFYADTKDKLSQQLQSFFDKQVAGETSLMTDEHNWPKLIMVPHAGYQFSGPVAAVGFGNLKKASIKRVFLLGCSHQESLIKATLSSKSGWKTPLGSVRLDQDLIDKYILKSHWQINDLVHDCEHSLEVQLPFLQFILSDFQIVPILVGQLSQDSLEKVVEDIAQNFDHKSLLVISTDLSHYPDAQLAEKSDQQLITSIISLDIKQFKKVISQTNPSQNLQTRACGAQAIEAGLQLAQKKNYTKVKLYQYQHSGNISHDKTQVVGYASLGFYST